MNKAIAGAEPQAPLFQRQARLYIARNGNQIDENGVESYKKMLELLDADPANMDPANGQLGLYKEAYTFLYVFYGNVAKDKDLATEYADKMNAVKALLGE